VVLIIIVVVVVAVVVVVVVESPFDVALHAAAAAAAAVVVGATLLAAKCRRKSLPPAQDEHPVTQIMRMARFSKAALRHRAIQMEPRKGGQERRDAGCAGSWILKINVWSKS
jgi:hypothetical protein